MLTKETLLTALIALKAEKLRLERYAEMYPDGGWSNDAPERLKSAVVEVEAELKKPQPIWNK